mmetsp:Transcript_46154/g.132939  ORF Transcript_46154/g.132939 Transcript_46154/m.132939 type:complete len:253 (+) Transcript_46154:514-1272(+)
MRNNSSVTSPPSQSRAESSHAPSTFCCCWSCSNSSAKARSSMSARSASASAASAIASHSGRNLCMLASFDVLSAAAASASASPTVNRKSSVSRHTSDRAASAASRCASARARAEIAACFAAATRASKRATTAAASAARASSSRRVASAVSISMRTWSHTSAVLPLPSSSARLRSTRDSASWAKERMTLANISLRSAVALATAAAASTSSAASRAGRHVCCKRPRRIASLISSISCPAVAPADATPSWPLTSR